jgi:GAF domain-containing protein
MVSDEIIGVLETVNSKRGIYTDDDLSLLSSFAELAAVSISNSYKFENLKEKVISLSESFRQNTILSVIPR